MNYITEHSQEELVDIRSVSIDPSLPQKERITEFLEQVKDPYHFKYGEIEVHVCYLPDSPTLAECLKQLIE